MGESYGAQIRNKKGLRPGEEGQWQGIIVGPGMSCRIKLIFTLKLKTFI